MLVGSIETIGAVVNVSHNLVSEQIPVAPFTGAKLLIVISSAFETSETHAITDKTIPTAKNHLRIKIAPS
jgi:hypothetical protein